MSKQICKHCGSEYEVDKGLHNWKKLFRKPTLDDLITLFIIIMVLFASWAYQQDTKVCRETLNNLEGICRDYLASEMFTKQVTEDANNKYYKFMNETDNIDSLLSGQVMPGNESA